MYHVVSEVFVPWVVNLLHTVIQPFVRSFKQINLKLEMQMEVVNLPLRCRHYLAFNLLRRVYYIYYAFR